MLMHSGVLVHVSQLVGSPKTEKKNPNPIYSLFWFCGINTLTVADFKLPAWCRGIQSWEETCTAGSWEPELDVSSTPLVVQLNRKLWRTVFSMDHVVLKWTSLKWNLALMLYRGPLGERTDLRRDASLFCPQSNTVTWLVWMLTCPCVNDVYFEVCRPGFESGLCYSVSVNMWMRHLVSPSLHFIICKWGARSHVGGLSGGLVLKHIASNKVLGTGYVGFSISFFYSLYEIVGLHYIIGSLQCLNLGKIFYYVDLIR